MSFSPIEIRFRGNRVICIEQWLPSPPWVRLRIDGEEYSFLPEEFKVLADWIQSVTKTFVKTETANTAGANEEK